MLDFTFQKLEQAATWQNFGLLFILFVLCWFGFRWRQKTVGGEVRFFDARFWYTPAEARKLLEQIGERGRRIYAFTQLTLDFLFPFVYGGLIIILFFKLYGDPKYLLLIPIITGAADLLENTITAYLALSYKGVASPLAWIAAIFTATKRIALGLSLITLLIGIGIFFLSPH